MNRNTIIKFLNNGYKIHVLYEVYYPSIMAYAFVSKPLCVLFQAGTINTIETDNITITNTMVIKMICLQNIIVKHSFVVNGHYETIFQTNNGQTGVVDGYDKLENDPEIKWLLGHFAFYDEVLFTSWVKKGENLDNPECWVFLSKEVEKEISFTKVLLAINMGLLRVVAYDEQSHAIWRITDKGIKLAQRFI
jgi:hypothetical protein